jgi:hypothetical protein
MVFDGLELRTVPVRVGNKQYVLREANGEATRRYHNALMKGARLDADGKPASFGDMADAELVLLQACLCDGSGRQLPMQTLACWPGRVLRPLFEKAQEISELKKGDDSEAGLVKREEALTKELGEVREKLARVRAPRQNGEAGEADPFAPRHADSPPGSGSPATSG